MTGFVVQGHNGLFTKKITVAVYHQAFLSKTIKNKSRKTWVSQDNIRLLQKHCPYNKIYCKMFYLHIYLKIEYWLAT